MTDKEKKAFVNNSTPTIQEEVITLRIENAKLKEHIIEAENDSNNCEHWSYEKISDLEKENAKLKAKLKNIDHYLAHDIPHELMNEATTKIWHML